MDHPEPFYRPEEVAGFRSVDLAPIELDTEIAAFYAFRIEDGRLAKGRTTRLEQIRMLELLKRFLPPPTAHVLEVSGGPGVHARELARLDGYDLQLIDPRALDDEPSLLGARDMMAATKGMTTDA
jgi:hypothetical protein